MAGTSETRAEPAQAWFTPKRRLAVLVLAACSAPIVVEASLRVILFSGIGLAERIGESWRDPNVYANRKTDSEYWRLRWHLRDGEGSRDPVQFDPVLGWTSARVASMSYDHSQWDSEEPRQPLLLYGASFAAFGSTTDTGYRAQMEASALSGQYALLNFGVGGYGADQVHALMERTIDTYAERRPVVIIALVLETDFDRITLNFRDWPKPRYVLDDGALRLVTDSVHLPGDALERHGIGIRSYAWKALLRSRALPMREWRRSFTREPQRQLEKYALMRALTSDIDQMMRSRELSYFFLLCNGPSTTASDKPSGMERRVVQHMTKQGIPHLLARPQLRAGAEARSVRVESLFLGPGRGWKHPTADGRTILFEAMMDGVQRVDELMSAPKPKRTPKSTKPD